MRNTTGEMPFLEHLAELRKRLLHSLVAITIGATFAYFWAGDIMTLVTRPIRISFPELKLIGTGPAEAFMCRLNVSLAGGVLLASPHCFLQVWLFVAPGLLQNERKLAVPFITASTLFFLSGVLFCYFLVLPTAFDFFSSEFIDLGLSPDIRIGEYLPFMVKLLLVFGLVFELPLIAFFLAQGGMLKSALLLKWVRHAIVASFIIAGVLTPPDVVSQTMMVCPLLAIYGISIGICLWVEKQKEAEKAKTDGGPPEGPITSTVEP